MRVQDFVVSLAAAWRRIVSTGIVCAVLAVGVNLLLPRHYTSSASFVPNAGAGLSALTGLASQFGVTLPGDNGGLSSEFYADFATSSAVIKWAISPDTAWGAPAMEVAPDIADLIEVSNDDPWQLQAAAVRKVHGLVDANVDPISQLVRVEVTTKSAKLSAFLAERLLSAVELFNSASRRDQARAEAEFAEARTADAKKDLGVAEAQMASFMEQNRAWSTSSRLTVEYDRLQRDLGFARTNYTSLVQALEQARLESMHNTSLITRVEAPVEAKVPDRRYSLIKGAAAAIVGSFGAALWVVLRTLLRAVGDADPTLRAAGERLVSEVTSTARFWRRRHDPA